VGIHLFLATARALELKKAKMVLFGAHPLVKESFNNVRLPELIPLADDEDAALALLPPA
jgi:anti-anti-sigma regulatory factor